jgi:hypothetical protein
MDKGASWGQHKYQDSVPGSLLKRSNQIVACHLEKTLAHRLTGDKTIPNSTTI